MAHTTSGAEFAPLLPSSTQPSSSSSSYASTRDSSSTITILLPPQPPSPPSDTSSTSEHPLLLHRSLFNRTFGPLSSGSLRGASFNLAASGVGAGVLSLPLVLRNCGLILGLSLLALGCVMTIWSMSILLWCGMKCGATSYSEMCEKIYGWRMKIGLQICLVLYCFGTLVAYECIIGNYLIPILSVFDFDPAHLPFPLLGNPSFLLTLFVTFLVFPLCLLRNISALRYASLASVLAMVYVAGCVAVRFWTSEEWAEEGFWKNVQLMNVNGSFFSSLAIVIFAFTCHINVFPGTDSTTTQTKLNIPLTRREGEREWMRM